MKFFAFSWVIFHVFFCLHASASDFAIVNATIHTMGDRGMIHNGTVLVRDDKIIAINPPELDVERVIDAKGKILTPGFIAVMTQLGLMEIGAEGHTRDDSDSRADILFDPSLAYNSRSTLVPLARKGGVTKAVVSPKPGTRIFAGQAFVANLSGENESVERTRAGIVLKLGSSSKGSRALKLQKLISQLEQAKEKEGAPVTKTDKLFAGLLAGKIPLLAYADRDSDLLRLIGLKERFNINMVIVGGADAVLIRQQLADANTPVIMSPMNNLPTSFDALHHSLKNASLLTEAGVKVLFKSIGSHYLYQLRFDAGNAVANGMEHDDALAAITANIADVFGLNSGRIEAGRQADLVLWHGDPLELNSRVERIWIDGREQGRVTRQDMLRQRYRSVSEMPAAYIK